MTNVTKASDMQALREQFKTFRLTEQVVTGHAKRRAKLLEQAQDEEIFSHQAQREAVARFGLVVERHGAAALLNLSYEQVILGLPGDLLYVYQKLPSGGWEEHLFGPACDDLERALDQFKTDGKVPNRVDWSDLSPQLQQEVSEYLANNRDWRVAECGHRIRYPRVQVAEKADGPLPGEVLNGV